MRKLTLRLLYLVALAAAPAANGAIPTAERQVLLNLYASTNGAGWSERTGWNGAAGGECGWFGITCDNTQSHVIDIELA